jgi:hypothetical protein
MIIETRSAWDSLLEIIHSDQVKTDLVFWQENIVKLNRKYLAGYSCSSLIYLYNQPSHLQIVESTIEIEFVTQVEYMLLANFCSSNFMLPDLTILTQFWLSVNHLIVLP